MTGSELFVSIGMTQPDQTIVGVVLNGERQRTPYDSRV